MIVVVRTNFPSGDRHSSHNPAKTKGLWSFMWIKTGILLFPFGFASVLTGFHSKNPLARIKFLRRLRAFLNDGFSASDSARALIIRDPMVHILGPGWDQPPPEHFHLMFFSIPNDCHRLGRGNIITRQIAFRDSAKVNFIFKITRFKN